MKKYIPIVTVLMPVYNAEKYLSEAIKSILNQTLTDFEFLIIDDGSTDRSLKICQEFSDPRIIIKENAVNFGIVKTLNLGIQLARGKYIARMDSDDISQSERLEKQVSFLNNHQNNILCGSAIQLIGEQNNQKVIFPEKHDSIKCHFLFQNVIAHPSVMFKTSVFKENNYYYPTNFPHAEDYALWAEVILKNQMSNLQEILLYHRIHKDQIQSHYFVQQKQSTKKLRQNLLSKLGVKFNREEIEFHENFCWENYDLSPEVLFKISTWFAKILAANRHSQTYNQVILSEVFKEKWLLCYSRITKSS